ncbi:MAG: hypothetical protein V3S64_06815 [bacterium]
MITPSEKFPPHQQRLEQEPAGGDKRQATGWRFEAAIGKLLAQVKANLAARDSTAGVSIEDRIEAEKWARYVSRAEIARAEILASAVSGLIKGISRVWRSIIYRVGKMAPGK